METVLTALTTRPYFVIDDQLADLYEWLMKGAHLFASNYVIGGLVIGVLLLIGLLRLCQK